MGRFGLQRVGICEGWAWFDHSRWRRHSRRSHSSVGKSVRIITVRSAVQARVGPLLTSAVNHARMRDFLAQGGWPSLWLKLAAKLVTIGVQGKGLPRKLPISMATRRLSCPGLHYVCWLSGVELSEKTVLSIWCAALAALDADRILRPGPSSERV